MSKMNYSNVKANEQEFFALTGLMLDEFEVL